MSGGQPLSVVALGGGHGLSASLTALRLVADQITAIVTVADNGGSSGKLRSSRGLLPPGDLRMALSALSEDSVIAQLWQHRFDGRDELAGHPVGNLVLAGLFEVLDDPVAALREAARQASVPHTVLPMVVCPVEIIATVVGLDPTAPSRSTEVRGQHAVATTLGTVTEVRIEPADPPACEAAVAAVNAADVIVLGPGSLYTSVLVHMLVPKLREAVEAARATRVLVLNLGGGGAQPVPSYGEDHGMSREEHLMAIARLAPNLRFDAVIADQSETPYADGIQVAAESLGAGVVFADVADGSTPGRHDPKRLAAAITEVLVDLASGRK